MSTFSIDFDPAALEAAIDAEEANVDAAVRPAAQAGAQVLYNAVERNVQSLGKKTGNLSRSIYQVYSKDLSGEHAAVYHVSWNHLKAPHGHLVENGYIKKFERVLSKKTGKWITLKSKPLATPVHVPGKGFVRRAQDEFPQAYQAMQDEFLKRIST